MFLLQFGLGLNCLEVCKQKEETMPSSNTCFLVFFLSFFFKVLKYRWKFLLWQCLSSKSSAQTSASFSSVEVCLHVCVLQQMFGFHFLPVHHSPLWLTDTVIHVITQVLQCWCYPASDLRNGNPTHSGHSDQHLLNEIEIRFFPTCPFSVRLKAIIGRLKTVCINVLNCLFLPV